MDVVLLVTHNGTNTGPRAEAGTLFEQHGECLLGESIVSPPSIE